MSWQEHLSPARRAAHAAWFDRGCRGEGRLVVQDANLAAARLSGPRLQRAAFLRCTFDGASMTYVDVTGGELLDCTGTKPTFHYLTLREARVERCRFIAADLRLAAFSRATMRDCDLSGSAFAETNCVAAMLTNIDFQRASLLDVQLDKSQLTACDFRGADLTGVTAIGSRFERCDFRGAKLDLAIFAVAETLGCTFDDAIGA